MLKKFSLIALAFFAVSLFAGVVFAQAEKAKPKVALLYLNNSKSTYDKEVNKKILDNFTEKLALFEVVEGTPYFERLNNAGIFDVYAAERSDIIEVFQGENIDYFIYADLQPFVKNEKETLFGYGHKLAVLAVMTFKIIDLKTGRYVYCGRFTEIADDSAVIANVGSKSVSLLAIDQVIAEINEVIAKRLLVHLKN